MNNNNKNSSSGPSLDDLDFSDKLFDDLLTELEFENYSNNDFATFNTAGSSD
jgi:hypothetical protein